MSILKFSAGPSAAAGIKYFGLEVDKAGRDKCVAWSNNLGLEGKDQVAQAWDLTRQEFENEGGREYYHASYNLDPNDAKSKEISNDTLLKIGSELAERLAPGHDYACFVHRDKDHPHVHVVWNTVHSESGRKYQQGPKDLEDKIRIKDELDRSYGLSVTERTRQRDRIPDGAQRIYARDPAAYLWTEDLKRRITAAREQAQGFEEFKSELAERGVLASERGKEGKLTYRFSDETQKQRIIREGRLGSDYGRHSIEREIGHKRELGRGHSESPRGRDHGRSLDERSPRDSVAGGDHGRRESQSFGATKQRQGAERDGRASQAREFGPDARLDRLSKDLVQRYGEHDRALSGEGRPAPGDSQRRVGAPGTPGEVEALRGSSAAGDRILFERLGWVEAARKMESGKPFPLRTTGTLRGVELSRGGEKILEGLPGQSRGPAGDKINAWRVSYGGFSRNEGGVHAGGLGRATVNDAARTRGVRSRAEQGLVSAFGKLRAGASARFGAVFQALGRALSDAAQRHEILAHSRASGLKNSALEFGKKLGQWLAAGEDYERDLEELKDHAHEAYQQEHGRAMSERERRELEREHIEQQRQRSRGLGLGW